MHGYKSSRINSDAMVQRRAKPLTHSQLVLMEYKRTDSNVLCRREKACRTRELVAVSVCCSCALTFCVMSTGLYQTSSPTYRVSWFRLPYLQIY